MIDGKIFYTSHSENTITGTLSFVKELVEKYAEAIFFNYIYHTHPNDCYYPTGLPDDVERGVGDIDVAKALVRILGACPKMGIYLTQFDIMVYFGPNSEFSDYHWVHKEIMKKLNSNK